MTTGSNTRRRCDSNNCVRGTSGSYPLWKSLSLIDIVTVAVDVSFADRGRLFLNQADQHQQTEANACGRKEQRDRPWPSGSWSPLLQRSCLRIRIVLGNKWNLGLHHTVSSSWTCMRRAQQLARREESTTFSALVLTSLRQWGFMALTSFGGATRVRSIREKVHQDWGLDRSSREAWREHPITRTRVKWLA